MSDTAAMTELKHILTSACKDEMIAFLTSRPDLFEEAMAMALADDQPYSWRAAWLLFNCTGENDARVKPYLNRTIKVLPDRADGHQRELLKILLKMELRDTHEARLFDSCMTMWEDISKSPSVRITAFRFIVKMAKKYPELANEMTGLTQDWYLDSLSPGVRKSVMRMLPGSAASDSRSHSRS